MADLSGDTVTDSDKSPAVTGPHPSPETVTRSDSPPLGASPSVTRAKGLTADQADDALGPEREPVF